jgi:hypothetical protein
MYLIKKEKDELLELKMLIYTNQTSNLEITDVKNILECSSDRQFFICDNSGTYRGNNIRRL